MLRIAFPAALAVLALSLSAQTPPSTPAFVEPAHDGQAVSPADVHMVTSAFADTDGDKHLCTDWQIVRDDEIVWEAPCAEGAEKDHIHLGDGRLTGSHADRSELLPDTGYAVRARHRDDSGEPTTEWSDWAERNFRTTTPTPVVPMMIRDVLGEPSPRWSITPPAGAALRLERVDGEPLLEIRDAAADDENGLSAPALVRAVLTAGEAAWALPASELSFEDQNGIARTIYLPALELAPEEARVFWVSENGSTHHADAGQRVPDFDHVARGAPVPWTVRERGYVVEPVVGGFQLPVNIAFAREGGEAWFYVLELYGTLKVVTRAGEVRDFATGLIDYDPTGNFPGNGEGGVAGLTIDPENGDLYVTGVFWQDRNVRELQPRVMRLRPSPDGLLAESVETVFAPGGERQPPSHQISNVTVGPDRKLYVHMGDGGQFWLAQDMTTMRGKILRINLDGTAPPDNPFYDAGDGIGPADFIYALGLRNPFGGSWRRFDQELYIVENGPSCDRLLRLTAGANFEWDGTDASFLQSDALLVWWPPTAPVQLTFVEPAVFGGSGFPAPKQGLGFFTESGPTWAAGPQENGKSISSIGISADGRKLDSGRQVFVEYDGSGRASAAGIAAGPDGLYFTNLYKDFDYESPIDRGAEVYRVRWTGYADFDVQFASADALTVDFEDATVARGINSWTWDFGDGTGSSEPAPRHRYGREGSYIVRLTARGLGETFVRTKKIRAGGSDEKLHGSFIGSDTLWDESQLVRAWGESESFTVRWRGTLRPRFSETYRLRSSSSGVTRIFVNGQPVEEGIELEAGQAYPVVVDFEHRGGNAFLTVFWESDSQGSLAIPRSSNMPGKRRSGR